MHLIGAVAAPQLLDGLVSAPRQLNGYVHAPTLVGSLCARMQ